MRRPRLGCDSGVTYSRTSDSTITRRRSQIERLMKVIDRRLYDPIISQLKRAVENNGRGANAALAEARRTKLTKHHPELAQLVEDVRRIH